MPFAPFVPLRVLSSYSMLEGAIDPKAIAKLAKERGFPAIAIADRNGLYGAAKGFTAALKSVGFEALAGVYDPEEMEVVEVPSTWREHLPAAPEASPASERPPALVTLETPVPFGKHKKAGRTVREAGREYFAYWVERAERGEDVHSAVLAFATEALTLFAPRPEGNDSSDDEREWDEA